MSVHRLPDWQMRLAALCQARASTPFAWGTHDCCLWAADAVRAMTGHDFAAPWRGTYATPLEAARLQRELGGLAAVATTALGPACAPLMAGVGDVVLLQQDGQDLLAVCNGTTTLVVTAQGLAAHGMGAARACWKVGHG